MLFVPYITFEGNAQEAIDFYSKALGATVSPFLMKYSEAQGMEVPPGYEDKVLHAELTFPGGILYISDAFPGKKVTYNDSISFNIGPETEEELNTLFTALGQGGQVLQPIADEFWGAKFGSLKDRFGIHWSFNYSLPKA